MLRSATTILLVLLFFSAFCEDTIKIPVGPEPNSTDQPVPAFVIFQGDTLFPVYLNLGPFTPNERADAIEDRLKMLSRQMELVNDSFRVETIKGTSLIKYGELAIMSLTEEDAEAEGHPRLYLAENYKEIIQASLANQIANSSLTNWIKRIGFTLLLLGVLIGLMYLINRLFKWINQRLIQYEKSLKRKRTSFFRYLAPKGPQYFFIFLSNLLKIAVIILILFFYLPLLFSFLPWTKGLVEQFYSYIAAPVKYVLNGIWNFLPNLFFIVVIIYIARYIIRILSYAASEVEAEKLKLKGFHKDWAKPTLNLLKIVIYAFTLVFIFPYLPGSDSPAFQGILIFLGVLLSLGSTSAIANIVAGIVITYMRPFKIGDRVKIADTIGDVMEKTLLVTKIKTLKNEDVTIPNATIINGHLWNFTKYAADVGLVLHTSVTIGYDVPWNKVNDLLIEAAAKTELVQKDPKPFVLQKSLDDNYVNYELNVHTKHPDKMTLIYSELHAHILEAFNAAGVEILSPRYVASRDGNESTIYKPDNRNPVEKIIDQTSGKKKKG